MSSEWCAVVICDISAVPLRRPEVRGYAMRMYSALPDDPGRVWLLARADDRASADRARHELENSVRASDGAIRVAVVGRSLGSYGEAARFASPWLLAVPMAAPASELNDLDRWYAEEHVDLLLKSPFWKRVDRYAIEEISGAAWSRLALHNVERADVLSTGEVRHAMNTPWRDRFACQPWFLGPDRALLKRTEAA